MTSPAHSPNHQDPKTIATDYLTGRTDLDRFKILVGQLGEEERDAVRREMSTYVQGVREQDSAAPWKDAVLFDSQCGRESDSMSGYYENEGRAAASFDIAQSERVARRESLALAAMSSDASAAR